MRKSLLTILISIFTLPAICGPSVGDRLVVHEWGTFTSFAGSDGVYLDYRTRIAADLPDFVLDRARQASVSIARPPYQQLFIKEDIATFSRMETPVTYFYTDRPTDVSVSVDFPKGLFTEFYPPVKKMAPLVTPAEISRKREPMVANGMLDWGTLRVTPMAQADFTGIPPVSTGDRYAAARETDSDLVQSTDARTGKISKEKFLFYRGICDFALPIALKSLGHDRFALGLANKTPIGAAFLVEVHGSAVRFTRYTDIRNAAGIALPHETSSLDALGQAMVHDLTAAGLYEKEARAMVGTWKSSWFGEDGTRLLYLLPQKMTDAVLPLHVSPKPNELVRVMVGRLEVMTPEHEGQVEALLASGDAALDSFGRFAEPTLARIAGSSKNAAAKATAAKLLAAVKH